MLGVRVLNGVNTPTRPGIWFAAAAMSCVAASSARGPSPSRSCSIILNPPAVPMPLTGGGGMVMMNASWMPDRRWRISFRIVATDRPCRSRSSNDVNGEKIAPEFDALVKVAPSKPENATACDTPGVLSMMSIARRTTASVRASEAPGGSWITVIR